MLDQIVDPSGVISLDIVSYDATLCHLLRHCWSVVVSTCEHLSLRDSLLALVAESVLHLWSLPSLLTLRLCVVRHVVDVLTVLDQEHVSGLINPHWFEIH